MVTIWFSFLLDISNTLQSFRIVTPYSSFLIETTPHQTNEWLSVLKGGKNLLSIKTQVGKGLWFTTEYYINVLIVSNNCPQPLFKAYLQLSTPLQIYQSLASKFFYLIIKSYSKQYLINYIINISYNVSLKK